MPSVTVRVPAKVNLYLGVGARRPDGFHELANVFQAVSLYDEVTAASGPGLSVRVEGEATAGVPTDSTNLAVRAAALLAETTCADPAVTSDSSVFCREVHIEPYSQGTPPVPMLRAYVRVIQGGGSWRRSYVLLQQDIAQ